MMEAVRCRLPSLRLPTYIPTFSTFQQSRPGTPLPRLPAGIVLKPCTTAARSIRQPVRSNRTPEDADRLSNSTVRFPAVPPSRSKQSNASTGSSQQIEPIFHREEELRVFRSYISSNEDASFVVAVGPPSSGKSTLLSRIKQETDALRRLRGDDVAPVILIDCRDADASTPERFAAAARTQAMGGWKWRLGRFLRKVNSANDVSGDNREEGLNGFFAEMRAHLETLPPGAPKPTIIIDEVNALLSWTKDRGTALRQLLNFLICWSKQKNALNVILASSHPFVFYWFGDYGLQREFYIVETIGNLDEQQARAYITKYLLPQSASIEFDKSEAIERRWSEIFEMTGGNMGEIRKVLRLTRVRNLDYALQELRIAARDTLAQGLAPATAAVPGKDSPNWTGKTFEVIVRAIVASHGGLVPRSKIYERLGKEGPAALRSLVEYNILQLRFPLPGASDLDQVAIAEAEDDVLVCPRAAADLVVMRRLVTRADAVARQ